MGADALLRGAHEVYRGEPLVERYVRVLEDGADRGRKLALALLTLQELARRLYHRVAVLRLAPRLSLEAVDL